jgi:hypothetical protein
VPVLGLAAYAAFDATLGLVGRDPEPPPPAARPAMPAMPAMIDERAAARLPAGELPAAALADPAATLVPEPSATPAQRAAAKGGGKPAGKKKPPAPRENLTEQDRRALERVLERAAEQGTR